MKRLLTLRLDVGKVLVGVQVPPDSTQAFETFLDELGYPFVEETENWAYQNLLRGGN